MACPGDGLTLEPSAADANVPKTQVTITSTLEHTFPTSVVDAMARGEVLQLVVFSFLFGTACAAVGVRE